MYNKTEDKSLYNKTQLFLKSNALEEANYDELVNLLQYHEWKYYVQNNPVISDFDYDTLFKKLQELESQFPDKLRSDSPTQRVSSDLSPDFPSVAHLNPMLSLANSYNGDDLKEFDKQIRKLCLLDENETIDFFVEPKYDGGSIALVYENDQLIRAATRGNGTQGEEMTANAKALPTIPLKAAFSKYGISKVELRGEAVIAKDTFEETNKKRELAGQALFANPRNAATGGLRMKDANESRKRGLEVFIFQMAYAVDDQGQNVLPAQQSHKKTIEILKDLGFKVSLKKEQTCKGIEAAIKACNDWERDREKFKYEIDGAVVKVDNIDLQTKSGSTQHHPRWAIAFKFKAKQAHTQLEEVEYQIGKTGAITPVAKVTPVQLAGVTVSSISLHNEDFIKQKDLRLGDTIVIERAGDVIPYVVKSLEELREGDSPSITFPTTCPSCDTALTKSEDEAAWRCPNYECKAQFLQRLIFHISKDAMNIDGLGKSNAETFFEKGWITDLSDVYNLDYEKISSLEGFGSRSVEKLKVAIEAAKQNPIQRLLHSLSIHHLGKKASKLIAQEITHVLDLKDWKEEQYTDIKDIGPVVAQNVSAYFSNEKHIEVLQKMEQNGVNFKQTDQDKPKQVRADAPLIGKTILFTGSLQTMSRKVAQATAEEAGAKNISAVSSKLNILVVGEKAGSKLKKAQALGTVQILTEEEFNQLVNS